MLDHMKAIHPLEKVDKKKKVKEKFGVRLFQLKKDFAFAQPKFSKEKQEMTYRAAAEVTLPYFNTFLGTFDCCICFRIFF